MRVIDADALKDAMYTETMLKDTDMQRWDSGCWIRYKLFENVLKEQSTVDAIPVSWIEERIENAIKAKQTLIAQMWLELIDGYVREKK